MAFWGVEVKPGKPYIHFHDRTRGTLRISQATLGDGTATKRTVIQCNVGNKSPVLLCSLLPDKTESCCLDLEFEENAEVIFSVLGPRSVHLTGYFPGGCRHSDGGGSDETDSYGEDIAETDSDESDFYVSEDEYEADFINDGDLEEYPSPRPKSGVIIEEIFDDEKLENGNANRRRLKKKHQVSDSDDGDAVSQRQIAVKHNQPVLESEDEDGFPISFFMGNKQSVKNSGGDEKTDGKTLEAGRKRKINVVGQDKGSERETDHQGAESRRKLNKKKKENANVENTPETGTDILMEENGKLVSEDQNHDGCDLKNEGKVQPVEGENTDLNFALEKDVIGKSAKVQKKKKERVKKGETSEAVTNESADKSVEKESQEEQVVEDIKEASNVLKEQDLPVEGNEGVLDRKEIPVSVSFGAAIESSGKRKKKNKKGAKDGKCHDGENKSIQELEKNGDKIQTVEDNKVELSRSKKKAVSEEMDEDLSVAELPNNKDANVGAGAGASEVGANKKKKKKSNTEENGSGTTKRLELKDEVQPSKTRTFPNGLAIEELSMGKPDGKRASPGKTVSVHYIGRLQKSEKIFDSNIGQRPFKFRLGIGEVIKGWDVGVNGMRIGDKRRLTIPPSMGYGSEGSGRTIPGNSWLVFDVELVDVK